jgi:protein-L-isoaspartate(D-aspartate) O-methyltransferase
MINEAVARLNMVESQLRTNKVTDEAVLDAFLSVPRARFVPPALRGNAYVDSDIPLGNGRAVMAPMVLARMLQAAAIGLNDKALVIGCGSGYTTALVSKIAASVVAVDSDTGCCAATRTAIGDLGYSNVEVVEGPLATGWRAAGPYNVIVISGAVTAIPAGVSDQLAEGGRLVTVVEPDSRLPGAGVGQATLMTRAEGALSSRAMFDAAVYLLPEFGRTPSFVF